MPPIELTPIVNVAVDILAWGVFHAVTGYAVHRLPASRLQHDSWLLAPRRLERSGRIYERIRIRSWKDRLPEAGALFAGGVSKRNIAGRDSASLQRFMAETRRAEYGHWAAMACGPLFVLWNPPVVAALMVTYGIAVNLPFIAIQRYNRARLARVLERRVSNSSSVDASDDPSSPRRAGESNGSNMP